MSALPNATRHSIELVTEDEIQINAVLNLPDGLMPKTAIAAIQPTSSRQVHLVLSAMAERGFAALAIDNRFAGTESALIVEQVLLDLAAGVAYLREHGFERVALLANSGGGGLCAFYQAEAEVPTVRSTPSGQPPDLTKHNLPTTDAIIFLNAHRGRAQVLTTWCDPAVVDEQEPLLTDAELDLFAPQRKPPFSESFITRYRTEQVKRNDRITSWALSRLTTLASHGFADQAFTVHRTTADPRFVDLTIDQSDRTAGSQTNDDVRSANNSSRGLARHTTLQSWLSQWSLRRSHAGVEANVARISVPLLFLQGTADRGIFPSDTIAMHGAARADDRRIEWLAGFDHYLRGPQGPAVAFDIMSSWLASRGF